MNGMDARNGRGRAVRRLILAGAVLAAAGFTASAQELSWPLGQKYWIIYPEYLSEDTIAVSEEVGILNLELSLDTGAVDITQVVLSPLDAGTDNTFDAYEELGATGKAVHGYLTGKTTLFAAGMAGEMTYSGDNHSVSVAGSGGVITVVFDGANTITAGPLPTKLHISIDIPAGTESADLAYRIDSITFTGGINSPLSSAPTSQNDPFTVMRIRDFDTTLTAVDPRGTDDAEQETALEILKLTFGDASDEDARRRLDGFTFTSLGTADADILSVLLYRDNGNGTFFASEEAGLGAGTWTPGSPSGGTAVFTDLATTYAPTNTAYGDPATATTAVYWFVVEIASGAVEGDEVRFEVSTPGGADIVFYDDVAEPVAGSAQVFTQVGYIGSPPAVQSNVHPVIPKQTTDTTPPTVISTSLVPGVDAYGVARSTTFQITFNDASGMDPASLNVTDPNFALFDDTDAAAVDVSGWGSSVTPDRRVWTLTPDAILDYSKSYTATVIGAETGPGVQDNAGTPNVMAIDYQWSFTTEAEPQVNFTFPGPSATGVSIDPAVTVAFTKPMDEATVENPANFSLDNGAVVSGLTYNPTTRTVAVTLGGQLLYETLYTATVAAAVLDTNGNPLPSDYNWSFTTEAQPQITATSPEDGSINVSIDPTISATFTKPMDEAAVENLGNFSLDNAADVTGITYASGAQTMTVSLGSPLLFNTAYTAIVSNAVTDANGNPLTGDYSWTFTTEARPRVTITTPSEEQTGVSITPVVTATFSKAMDPATVIAANFDIDSGAIVTGLTYDEPTQTMTASLGAPLEFLTYYTATVSTAMTDTNGNGLAADFVWRFTTTSKYPDFDEPIALNNVITPGSAPSVKIFVQQPPDTTPSDIVQIQVFNVTGRRVATLTGTNETYGEVIGRLPIVWNGTNGRAEELGPGLYFIQIRSRTYRKVLKVMIVR